jgi:hypothetical protein
MIDDVPVNNEVSCDDFDLKILSTHLIVGVELHMYVHRPM